MFINTHIYSHLNTHTNIFYTLRTQNGLQLCCFPHEPGYYVPSAIKFDFPHFCFPSITSPLPDTGRTICSAKKNSFFCSCFLLYLLIFFTKLSPPPSTLIVTLHKWAVGVALVSMCLKTPFYGVFTHRRSRWGFPSSRGTRGMNLWWSQ